MSGTLYLPAKSTTLETTTEKLRLVILSSRPFHRPHLELLTSMGAHNKRFSHCTGPPIPWLEPEAERRLFCGCEVAAIAGLGGSEFTDCAAVACACCTGVVVGAANL